MPQRVAYRTRVRPEWIDHNGHMNVAYFVLAFDEATDDVYEEWGLGLDHPGISGCSVFTLGMNIDYLGELFEGDEIRVETALIDCDSKRIHYVHEMFRGETDSTVATNECLAMNVDLNSRKSRPFSNAVQQCLGKRLISGPRPKCAGRALGIRRGKPG